MRTLLMAAVIVLLGYSGSVCAEGTVVRWNAIVGMRGQEADSINLDIGPLTPGNGWIYVDSGFATLNVDTGAVHIVVRYISWASNSAQASSPIGSVLGGAAFPRRGKFVCDAREAFGPAELVVTEPFFLDRSGSANYVGSVDLPQVCRDHPDQIAFTIGGANNNTYFAFGAGGVVLGIE